MGIPPLIPQAITALDGINSAGLSLRQRYTVTLVRNGVRTDLTPVNQPLFAVPVECRSAYHANYPALARQGVYNLASGVKVFAGTADDPFYIDLGATFDSLNFRAGSGSNATAPLLSNFDDQNSVNATADTLADST